MHIVQRGHNREPRFFAEEDYSSYLHWLGEVLAETECTLLAYLLMTNHVYLLVTPKKTEARPKPIITQISLQAGHQFRCMANWRCEADNPLYLDLFSISEVVGGGATEITCGFGETGPLRFFPMMAVAILAKLNAGIAKIRALNHQLLRRIHNDTYRHQGRRQHAVPSTRARRNF